MLYKCNNCSYCSNKRSNLIRHEKKKISCSTITKVNNDNIIHNNNNNLDNNNNSLDNNNNSLDPLVCGKCKRKFSSASYVKIHKPKCNGLDTKQCPRCLKYFKHQQAKWKHMKFVKCQSPIQSNEPSITINNITHNITNNIDNSTNNIHNNNYHMVFNFGQEDLSVLTNNPEYMRSIQDCIRQFIIELQYLNEDAGKLIIAEIVKLIYFNKKFPQNQTIRKTTKKDNDILIHMNNEWIPRILQDVFKKILYKVEKYFTPYFISLINKFENKDKDDLSRRDKMLITESRGFGKRMVWFDWDIDIINDLNSIIDNNINIKELDDRDIETQNKIFKNTIKCLSQVIYDNTNKNNLK